MPLERTLALTATPIAAVVSRGSLRHQVAYHFARLVPMELTLPSVPPSVFHVLPVLTAPPTIATAVAVWREHIRWREHLLALCVRQDSLLRSQPRLVWIALQAHTR